MSNQINTCGPAFPSPEIRGMDGCGISPAWYGMTLREWYIGKAISGLCAIPGLHNKSAIIAQKAISIADSIIALELIEADRLNSPSTSNALPPSQGDSTPPRVDTAENDQNRL